MQISVQVHAAFFSEHTSEDPRDAPRQKHFQDVIKNTVEAVWPEANVEFSVDDEDYDIAKVYVYNNNTTEPDAEIKTRILAFESAAVISAALAFP